MAMNIYRYYWMMLCCGLAVFVFFSVVAAGNRTEDAARITPRIIGGTDAQPGDYPWMAALVHASITNLYSGFFCGGALIHPQWVVTAAHCVKYKSAHNVDLVLNITDLTANVEERLKISQIEIHPDYNNYTLDSDIALLKLQHPVIIDPLSYGKEGGIVSSDTSGGELGIALGWGSTSPYQSTYPSVLQQVVLPLVSNETCRDSFAAKGFSADYITKNMLCAGYVEGGKDACIGDSGGPLVVMRNSEYELVGIISWGEGCAEPEMYGVYTRVSNFTSFIASWLNDHYLTGIITADIPGHKPVPLAQVNLSAGGVNTVSDPQGFFLIYLEPGTYQLNIDAPGFVKTHEFFTIPPHSSVHLTPIISPVQPGDHNRDGRVDLKDVISILKMLTGS